MLIYCLGAVAGIALLILLVAYICFRMAFLRQPEPKTPDGYSLPQEDIYIPYHDKMRAWMQQTRALPCEEVCITSFDGLKLRGRYYAYAPGAPVELMMPGYRGIAERDLCGGVQRAFSLGRSVLIVDQRACGNSEGKVITFGIRERLDCLAWAEYLANRFGKDTKIILTGISMGAATVMMASVLPLPENVVGIIADCGYTSPKEIIKKVIRDMKLPAAAFYPFVKLAARIYGGFDLEKATPIDAMGKCSLPVFFAHGEADDYVPHQMTLDNYAACKAPKVLLSVPHAGHGLAYVADPSGYIQALKESAGDYAS